MVVTSRTVLVRIVPVRQTRQGSTTKLPSRTGSRISGSVACTLPRSFPKKGALARTESVVVFVPLHVGGTMVELVLRRTYFPEGERCPNLVTTLRGEVVRVRPTSWFLGRPLASWTSRLSEMVLRRWVILLCPRVTTLRSTLPLTR